MKKISILVAVGLFTFAFSNCESPTTEEVTTGEEVEVFEDQDQEEDHHHAEEGELSLNDGAKWIINEEMKPHVLAAENRLAAYLKNNSGDYSQLADELKELNTELIKSCTMTGKSHDELHNWLHPHMDILAELEKAEDVDSANEAIAELSESFEIFHKHFE